LLPVVCLCAAILAGCAGPLAIGKKEADADADGVTYLEQRNLPSAMRELTKASELDPAATPEVDMTLGLVYRRAAICRRPRSIFRRAIERIRTTRRRRNNLASVLAERKAWDEAIREFEAAGAERDVRGDAANVHISTSRRGVSRKGDSRRARRGVPAGPAANDR